MTLDGFVSFSRRDGLSTLSSKSLLKGAQGSPHFPPVCCLTKLIDTTTRCTFGGTFSTPTINKGTRKWAAKCELSSTFFKLLSKLFSVAGIMLQRWQNRCILLSLLRNSPQLLDFVTHIVLRTFASTGWCLHYSMGFMARVQIHN